MGKVTGFLEIDRQERKYAPTADRVRHYNEFVIPLSEEGTRNQAQGTFNGHDVPHRYSAVTESGCRGCSPRLDM